MFLNRATFIGFASAKVVAFFHSPKLFAKKIQKNRIFYVFAHFLSLNRHFSSQPERKIVLRPNKNRIKIIGREVYLYHF